jgi:hypothetical protein
MDSWKEPMTQPLVLIKQDHLDALQFGSLMPEPARFTERIVAPNLSTSFYARVGHDSCAWRFSKQFWNTVLPCTEMPAPCHSSSDDFAQVMDSTVLEYRRELWSRPWYIDWSGGIDSTAMIVAILRNLCAADRDNVTVVMNEFSYWENPNFYKNHVLGNFKCVSPYHYDNHIAHSESHYRFNGNPADLLWGAARALEALHQGIDISAPWRHSNAQWQQLKEHRLGTDAARWLDRMMAQNIDSVPEHDVTTIRDWYWWLNFNFKWLGKLVYNLANDQQDQAKSFLDTNIAWYANRAFQAWSMVHGRFSLADTNIENYKKQAKDYILSWDHDPYYRKFKLKFQSVMRSTNVAPSIWALDQDFRILSSADLNQNPAMVWQHLNDSAAL